MSAVLYRCGMNPLFLLRMALWARRRPSRQMVIVVVAVAVAAIVLVSIEHFFGWPDALTVNSVGRRGPLR